MHDTGRRVFMPIDPDAFEAGFAKRAGSLADRFQREAAAILGRAVRRLFDHGREQSPLRVASAWAGGQGLVRGHSRKLAEAALRLAAVTAAVPELLDQLVLENSILALDAMGGRAAPQALRVSAGLPRRSWRAGAIAC